MGGICETHIADVGGGAAGEEAVPSGPVHPMYGGEQGAVAGRSLLVLLGRLCRGPRRGLRRAGAARRAEDPMMWPRHGEGAGALRPRSPRRWVCFASPSVATHGSWLPGGADH